MIAEYEAKERPALYDTPRLYGLNLKHKHLPEMKAVCGLEKYKGRLLFNAGEKPYLALRLKKGDNVLKLAGIVLADFQGAEPTAP